MSLCWVWSRLGELAPEQIHAVFGARQAVFVLEQTCLYPDIDGLDLDSWHLLGSNAGVLCAYLRVVPPGRKYKEPSIGRVLTVSSVRAKGYGQALMREGIRRTEHCYPNVGIRISAQCYLRRFYENLGFVTVGEPYDEDGIAHQEMLRA